MVVDKKSCLRIAVLGALVSLTGCPGHELPAAPPASQSTLPMLWREARTNVRLPPSAQAVESRPVSVDLELLRSQRNGRLGLMLPNGKTIVAVRTRETRRGKAYTWHGKIEGDPTGSVNLAVVGDSIVGDITTTGAGSLRLRDAGARGLHVLDRVDPKRFPNEEDPEPEQGRNAASEEDTCATDSAEQIDVMVAYTDDARVASGGVAQMEATVYLAIEETNQSYIDSNVAQRLNLVHMTEVNYAESGSTATDLPRLEDPADGQLDNLHTLRNAHAADIVSLIVETITSCGRGNIMESVGNAFESDAFNVVRRDCATGNFSFGHELGHNMSARHDWNVDSTNNTPHAYNHAHIQPSPTNAGTTPWRTIMAYNDGCVSAGSSCTRLARWSNPNQTIGGDAVGVATGTQQEHNRRTLNDTALTVANFRCSGRNRSDVWMKDAWNDTGAEPDAAQASMEMWQSPYIWVRNAADTNLTHRHQHQNPVEGQQNFLYTKLHNGGGSASGNLELYAAPASTGLAWPGSWTLVQSQALTLAASATRIAETAWTPPGDGHYCLIARWTSAADPMAAPETADIDANTRANNNIIWRNVNVVDLGGDNEDTVSLLVANPTDGRMLVDLYLRPTGPLSFLDFGTVSSRLDGKLMDVWKAANYGGEGFSRSGNTLVVNPGKGAVLRRLVLPPTFEGRLSLTFKRPASGYPRDKFSFEVVQIAGRRTIGGVAYDIRTESVED
jgi:hypothetical protein